MRWQSSLGKYFIFRLLLFDLKINLHFFNHWNLRKHCVQLKLHCNWIISMKRHQFSSLWFNVINLWEISKLMQLFVRHEVMVFHQFHTSCEVDFSRAHLWTFICACLSAGCRSYQQSRNVFNTKHCANPKRSACMMSNTFTRCDKEFCWGFDHVSV